MSPRSSEEQMAELLRQPDEGLQDAILQLRTIVAHEREQLVMALGQVDDIESAWAGRPKGSEPEADSEVQQMLRAAKVTAMRAEGNIRDHEADLALLEREWRRRH